METHNNILPAFGRNLSAFCAASGCTPPPGDVQARWPVLASLYGADLTILLVASASLSLSEPRSGDCSPWHVD